MTHISIQGNLIGTNAPGDAAIANGQDGVYLSQDVTSNTIGGATAGAGNLISGNTGDGIYISHGSLNVVAGNYIGTNAAGQAGLPNLEGVQLANAAANNTIGGPSSELLVSNYEGSTVNEYTPAGGAIGSFTGAPADFNPAGMAINAAGDIFVYSRRTYTIEEFGPNGHWIETFVPNGLGTSEFGNLAFLPNGDLLVALSDPAEVLEYSPSGASLGVFTSGGPTLQEPTGIKLGPDGNVYVVDNIADAINVYSQIGTFLNSYNMSSFGEYSPVDLAFGPDGLIYVADYGYSDAIGGYVYVYSADFASHLATYDMPNNTYFPEYIAIGPNGDIYVDSEHVAFNGVGYINAGGYVSEFTPYVSPASPGGTYLGDVVPAGVLSGPGDLLFTTGTGSNVISGNTGDGIQITGSWDGAQRYRGERDRRQCRGHRRGRQRQRRCRHEHSHNTIGGTTAGAVNFISGNTGDGVYLSGGSFNTVDGDYIGLSTSGTALGNDAGVVIDNGAQDNTIGTVHSGVGGTSAGRNIISGNTDAGVVISGLNTISNAVVGDFIGSSVQGDAGLGVQKTGIAISDSAASNDVGGAAAHAGNVIFGNTNAGVVVTGTIVGKNVIAGNYIGVDHTGQADPLALQDSYGLELLAGADNNTLVNNVIGGNRVDGVLISGTSNERTLKDSLQTNDIGINRTGQAVGNGDGVAISAHAASNIIGGSDSRQNPTTFLFRGNTISFNRGDGIYINAGSANLIEGNYIGTNLAGTAAAANAGYGVAIVNGASGNIVGGAAVVYFGLTPQVVDSNVISGNRKDGILISGSTVNKVEANNIVTNQGDGVALTAAANSNTIGGSNVVMVTIGHHESAAPRNLISGNTGDGIFISASSNDRIFGNAIGLSGSDTALGNDGDGVLIENGSGNEIGKQATANTGQHSASAINFISGNALAGVEIEGHGAAGNLLNYNEIGVNTRHGRGRQQDGRRFRQRDRGQRRRHHRHRLQHHLGEHRRGHLHQQRQDGGGDAGHHRPRRQRHGRGQQSHRHPHLRRRQQHDRRAGSWERHCRQQASRSAHRQQVHRQPPHRQRHRRGTRGHGQCQRHRHRHHEHDGQHHWRHG